MKFAELKNFLRWEIGLSSVCFKDISVFLSPFKRQEVLFCGKARLSFILSVFEHYQHINVIEI
ncbi:hypothetical protein [Streptococcus mutans]|uniref:hypothetical protein n=1 Tax=Streptococcus mutans TaxID=1309 RepID=UPI0027410E36|nr:hypothetical protein [Streptococcus mutans]MDP5872733.1 hypothetical protein [Streptococcus mutans]